VHALLSLHSLHALRIHHRRLQPACFSGGDGVDSGIPAALFGGVCALSVQGLEEEPELSLGEIDLLRALLQGELKALQRTEGGDCALEGGAEGGGAEGTAVPLTARGRSAALYRIGQRAVLRDALQVLEQLAPEEEEGAGEQEGSEGQ
jgi:hypothetical protein